jgi:6-phosphogluconolactonase
MRLHRFPNRYALANCLATDVGRALSAAISKRGTAVLAVSGGATPTLFFEHLSQVDISWTKVTITLVDERAVPETSERSNARLVRSILLQNHCRQARFQPLFESEAQAEQIPSFDAVVLGMGRDGHTASFFPGSNNLAEAVDPQTARQLLTMEAPGAGEKRITFTLPRLLQAKFLALHIEGADKWRVLQEAEAGKDKMLMPIRAVLEKRPSLDLYWCP